MANIPGSSNADWSEVFVINTTPNGTASSFANEGIVYTYQRFGGNYQFDSGIVSSDRRDNHRFGSKVRIGLQNSLYRGFISALDIFKTSLEVSNVNDDLMVNADGKNIMNYINDNTIQNENLFWRKDKMATVRSGNYKLIRLNDTSTVLYNIENNFFEDLDLKLIEPSVHDSLFKLLSSWEDRLINPNWIENKDWNIVTEMIYQD